jgi:small subunit ribosomal protein S8
MIDPIVDMLNRIRNASMVLHPTVSIPFSNLKQEIAGILEKEKFIEKQEKRGKKTKKIIKITLKYEDKHPFIIGLQRISKQGQRVYVSKKEARKARGGRGIAIISTPKGLMTGREARRRKLGGEIICEVW